MIAVLAGKAARKSGSAPAIVGRVHQAQRNRVRARMVRRDGDLTGGQVRGAATDIAASNGVIHVIDTVIMPARN